MKEDWLIVTLQEQRFDRARIKRLRNKMEKRKASICSERAKLYTQVSVSYTHLDVYKRQIPCLA